LRTQSEHQITLPWLWVIDPDSMHKRIFSSRQMAEASAADGRQRIPAPLRDEAPLSLQDITVLSELGKPSHLG
jgi:hypothetical protein